KTQLLAGRILTPAMLRADATIRKGQAVTLIINSGGINVQMSGKALMDGALNQRIQVENTNSGRVVEGIVRSPEHVEVLVATAGQFFNAKPKVSPPLADMRSSNNDR
ncbi:MAG: flagellar basal body P-ring formation protein FlgA, partial [Gammaproteobacteria bacterium]|nr:flagellar basal body P-ring formation protein FlgA [Gammaproteobacteria bacterium]